MMMLLVIIMMMVMVMMMIKMRMMMKIAVMVMKMMAMMMMIHRSNYNDCYHHLPSLGNTEDNNNYCKHCSSSCSMLEHQITISNCRCDGHEYDTHYW